MSTKRNSDPNYYDCPKCGPSQKVSPIEHYRIQCGGPGIMGKAPPAIPARSSDVHKEAAIIAGLPVRNRW